MRFIGNKENLLDRIFDTVRERGVGGDSLFDFFAGTAGVGRYFKKKGYKVYSSDLLYFSYILQQAYIVNGQKPFFGKIFDLLPDEDNSLFPEPLDRVVSYLNSLPPVEAFIYNNYTPGGTKNLDIPRMYFIDSNGRKIDAIRQKIEEWNSLGLLEGQEYYVLLACLIESVPFYANIAGVYAAFQKKWDPRALKPFVLRRIELVLSEKNNEAYNVNSVELLDRVSADIFYLDPPYNQRQYAPNYHLLETLALWDSPTIKGVAGLRPYQDKKSKFCNKDSALTELSLIAQNGNYKTLILSYSTEGIMSQEDIVAVLEKYGVVELVEFDYLRFKSHSRDLEAKKIIKEQLYILKRHV